MFTVVAPGLSDTGLDRNHWNARCPTNIPRLGLTNAFRSKPKVLQNAHPSVAARRCMNTARFFSLLFAALALAPTLAHLMELPNKIGLPREQYFIVQQIYRGWALLGFVVFGALLSTLVLTMLSRKRPMEFALSLLAFLCIVGTQFVFWTFTFPTNQQTSNWTVVPENWVVLRNQWEYSHALSACLNLLALIALIACATLARSSHQSCSGSSFHDGGKP
jgi:hypothetical protein